MKFSDQFEEEIKNLICLAKNFDEKLIELLLNQWKLLEKDENERIKKFSCLIVAIEELYGEEVIDDSINTICSSKTSSELVTLRNSNKTKKDLYFNAL